METNQCQDTIQPEKSSDPKFKKQSKSNHFVFRKPLSSIENYTPSNSSKSLKNENPQNAPKVKFPSNEDSDKENIIDPKDTSLNRNGKRTNDSSLNPITSRSKRRKPLRDITSSGLEEKIQPKSGPSDGYETEKKTEIQPKKNKTEINHLFQQKSKEEKIEEDKENKLSYADVIEKNTEKFKNEFKLHEANRPSSEESMKAQLENLRQKKFPFHYTPQHDPMQLTLLNKSPKKDPLKYSEGEKYLMAHLHSKELTLLLKEDFMANQADVSERMRAVLIDWMSDVICSFKVSQEGFFLSVVFLDHHLAASQVQRSQFQLVGSAAMFAAFKFTEVQPPVAKEFVYAAANSFEAEELYEMEKEVLKSIGWGLPIPPHVTMTNSVLEIVGADQKIRSFSFFLLELAMYESAIASVAPSAMTSAAVFVALHQSGGVDNLDKGSDCLDKKGKCATRQIVRFWKNKFGGDFRRSYKNIKGIAEKLVSFVLNPNQYENSIRKKYSIEKFFCVSKTAKKVVETVCFCDE